MVRNEDLISYVEEHISQFHKDRLCGLSKLKLDILLSRKNPYLFKAKNINTPEALVRALLDAYLSSQEETLLGTFLEGLAIYVCKLVYNGQKSSAEGIDLEFETRGMRYIVSIKSGPNWGNSSQIKRMIDNFKKSKQILRTNKAVINTVAVNGCCYGKTSKPDKGDYLKLCGKEFWELITGDPEFFVKIIEPIGYNAKKRNDEFFAEYDKIICSMTQLICNNYIEHDQIDWEKILRINSDSDYKLSRRQHT